MIRKWLLKIFINLYLKKNREINKLSPENEFNKFKFSNPEDVFDILRSFLTSQTIAYWECKNDYERAVVKGSGLILRLLIDLHNKSLIIDKNFKNKDAKIKQWLLIKNNLLDEITNQKTR